MRSGAHYRLLAGAMIVAALAGGCGEARAPRGADTVTKQAWMQPAPPEQADQLRQRLIVGQADH